jgi:endoglucanase
MNTRRLAATLLAFVMAVVGFDVLGAPGSEPVYRDGGIVRGPQDQKRIALVFTGHEFAEGGPAILDALAKCHAQGSFFLTGDFLANTNFTALVRRMIKEGHYVGPHSDKHLLYCAWDGTNQTLVTREQFQSDVERNILKLEGFGVKKPRIRYFLPAYEHYNREIADWSKMLALTLIDFTPGTRANADYTGEADKNFVSSQAIFDSIAAREHSGPDGLNGFILLLHLGAGPGRTDKFSARFGELLDHLTARGYRFVRVDDLLGSK